MIILQVILITSHKIFEYKNLPIGQVRFDGAAEVVLSYSIDSAFRGRGWGQIVLQNAIEKFRVERKQSAKIIGYVKQANISSNVVFKNLGFSQSETLEYPNSNKYELLMN